MKITIIGAGVYGVALGKILEDNGHSVAFFDKKGPLSFPEATLGTEGLVIAVPSGAVEKVAEALPEYLRALPVILATKGLLSLWAFGGYGRLSMLSGPAFAADIMAGRPVKFTATDFLAQELFANARVEVEISNDLLGVMLCGSLKNIYAIGVGLAYEKPKIIKTIWADEAQVQSPTTEVDEVSEKVQKYLELALEEMRRYLTEHGAKGATVELACGKDDLFMTATDTKSRNLRFGRMLAGGELAVAEIVRELGTVEGLSALEKVDYDGYPMIAKIYEKVHAAPQEKEKK